MCLISFRCARSVVTLMDAYPTPEQARRGLDGNVCRCGTFVRVMEAAMTAKGVARG